MAKHLFIVHHQESDLFSYLARAFSAEPDVTVILDRRRGGRRTDQGQVAADQRHPSDRRARTDTLNQLATLGYAFVRLT